MTNILKPKISMPAQQQQSEAMEKQEEILEKQEKRVAKQESDERARLAASLRARRTGGYRSLLSPTRFGLSGVNNE